MSGNENTFVRLTAFSYRWARGEFARRATGLFAGLLTDLATHGAWTVLRWTLPLRDSPGDLLPYLLRELGLPAFESGLSYPQEWARTMTRLENALATHSAAGSVDQLLTAAANAGIENATIELDTGSSFWIKGTNVLGEAPIGGFTIGDGTLLGYAVDPRIARNVLRAMRYFKPARERFRGVKAA